MSAKYRVYNREKSRGFTLIELSIVLVIIGLIVGGVLVGQDLIKAAQVRATITQVEKFNTAVNTFRGKYGALPGDLNAATATQFGFSPRGSLPGQGDGDGILEGFQNPGTKSGLSEAGETLVFWVDLSTANGQNLNLIEGSFSVATPAVNPFSSPVTGSAINLYLPAAKLGGGNHFYVWSGGPKVTCCAEVNHDSQNYFGLSSVQTLGYTNFFIQSSPGLTVSQAFAIDSKIDDGFPQSGNVTADYPSCLGNCNSPTWAGAGITTGAAYTTATPGSATSCFDNNSTVGTQQYSVEISGGANVNCALSFRFQ